MLKSFRFRTKQREDGKIVAEREMKGEMRCFVIGSTGFVRRSRWMESQQVFCTPDENLPQASFANEKFFADKRPKLWRAGTRPKTKPGKKSKWFHFYTFTGRLHLPLAFATLLELSPFSTIYLHGGNAAGGQVAFYGQLGNISAERHFSGDVELKVYQKNVCRDEKSSNLFSSTGNCWHERECGIRRRSMREKSKYRSRGCSSRVGFAFNGQLHRQTRSISFRL